MNLNRPELLKEDAYIDGQWTAAEKGDTFEVRNPFNNDLLANVADLGENETLKAISAAKSALKEWGSFSASKRSRILRKWYELQLTHAKDLATILTLEQGKPFAESLGEIKYGASFVEWFAEEAKRVYGDTIPGHSSDKRIVVIKQPVGVVAAITPWNFPSAMITRKVAPALAAGCTVVIKPAELTPLSATALAVLAEEAGFPPGVMNIVTSNQAPQVGLAMTNSKDVKKLSFTGSTQVGKILLKQSADTVKKVTLELGGNAPFIVFDDADIDAAVQGAIASKYRNAGQTCICSNRIFVQEGVYESFVQKFTETVKEQKLGDGMERGTVIGPMIEKKAVDFVEGLVADASDRGARVVTGGKRGEGLFFEPTVIADVTEEMEIFRSEIFGPVAPVYKFSTEEEVLEMANNTDYGLASYFYGRDYARIWRVAEGLEYGMVGINTGMISTAVAPFGGIKQSGFGREGSKYGIEDYLNIKYMCWHLD